MIKNIYNMGIYLLLFMFYTLCISFLFFYMHISISVFNTIISLLLTSITLYFLKGKLHISNPFKIILYSIGLLLIFLLVATFIFDRSSDGNTYHKDAISNLARGWNPVYESSKDFSKNYYKHNDYNMSVYTVWKDHYSKGNWILEANIYKLTGNIESGKIINYIFMFILFSLSIYFFSPLLGKKSIIISLLLVFNPIICAQLFTFYNDQLGTTILFSLIISLMSITSKKNKKDKLSSFLIMSMLFVIILNIKFNMLGYGMVVTFVFMLKYLYMSYKDKKFTNNFGKLSLLFIVLFLISLVFFGYSTYIKNYVDHKNAFFPVYGKGGEDIITKQEPTKFLKYNTFQKTFYSVFSKTDNLMKTKKTHLKIPFTFDYNEIKQSASVDTRIGGFGVLFSGLLLISIFIIISYRKKLTREEKNNILLICLTIFIFTFMISEGWWARYNPSLYLLIIIGLYIALKYSNSIMSYLYCFLIIINILPILSLNTGYTLVGSYNTYNTLKKMENERVEYNLSNGEPIGILSNLDDYHIKYVKAKYKLKNTTYYNYLNYSIK